MNKVLVKILDAVNTISVLVIILTCTLVGGNQFGGAGYFFGLCGGLVTSAVVCGVLALGLEIRRELAEINRLVSVKMMIKKLG